MMNPGNRLEYQFSVYEAQVIYNIVRMGDRKPISDPNSTVAYMAGAFDDFVTQEQFWVILVDTKNCPIGRHRITIGTVNSTLVSPREVFRPAIVGSATSIICVHNHPSGDPAPSSSDIKITRMLSQASIQLEIPLLDHVIIGEATQDPLGTGYYSFSESGLI